MQVKDTCYHTSRQIGLSYDTGSAGHLFYNPGGGSCWSRTSDLAVMSGRL